jgi:hypothetical protein
MKVCNEALYRAAMSVCVLMMIMTLTNCGGGGGDDSPSVSSPASSPASVPASTGLSPDSDVSGTYTFVFDNATDGTVFTAYIRSATALETVVDKVKFVERHSYKKTGNDTADGLFQWSTYVWWNVNLKFTSSAGGTFVVTDYDKNNTGQFTLNFDQKKSLVLVRLK